MLGRGLRLSPETGKEDCLVIDLVASGERAGGMVCTPTLFGVDPDAEIEGEYRLQYARSIELAAELCCLFSLGQSTSELRRSGEERQQLEASSKSNSTSPPPFDDLRVQYTDYETAFDYVSSGTKGDVVELDENGDEVSSVHVNRISKLAWIGCGEDVWVLELLGKGHVRIVKTRDGEFPSVEHQ